jgi:hypothetical protein
MKAKTRSPAPMADWMLGCQLVGMDGSKSYAEELSRALESELVELDEFMKSKLKQPERLGKVMKTLDLSQLILCKRACECGDDWPKLRVSEA